jgi:hypothetical protein
MTEPIDVDKILELLGDQFMDPGDDPWGGANLDARSYSHGGEVVDNGNSDKAPDSLRLDS